MIDRHVLRLEEIDRTQVGARRRQGRAPGGTTRRGHSRAGWLLRDDGRLPADPRARCPGSTISSIGCRAWPRSAGRRCARSARRSGGPSKASPSQTILTAAAITRSIARLGEQAACAVRSSATAEDLPTALFAGHHDSYLNVVGPGGDPTTSPLLGIALHRAGRGLPEPERQRPPRSPWRWWCRRWWSRAAGVLFTADPVTSNRKVAWSRPARPGGGPGVGPGGRRRVRYGRRVLAEAVATKRRAAHASPGGGTQEQAVDRERQEQPALTDAQVVELAQLGRRIQAHLGPPQDIEWCLADGGFQIVQSRPITTLFPIPVTDDGGPPLRLRRPWPDDDRRDEAPGNLHVAADSSPADVRGGGGCLSTSPRAWRPRQAVQASWRS